MDTQLTVTTDPARVIVPTSAVKDEKHRLVKYADWLATSARQWIGPDMAAYRDDLLASGYAPATVSAHLSTVRARYADLARDRDRLYSLAAQQTDDALERKAIVDELVARIRDAMDPEAAPVKVATKQDRADSEQLRLTSAQASSLLAAPGVATLQGLRDTAIIATLLCTGIREAELCALDVGDLRQSLGGEVALQVRQGKGAKQRLVPYGDLSWVLAILDKWRGAAGIDAGAVFRGFYKGGLRLRPGRLSKRQVQNILKRYPVMIGGELQAVRPHDCRRSYARALYDAGVDPVAIQQNLGHARLATTLSYVGTLDAEQRRAPAVFTFDLGALATVPEQRRL